MRKARERLYGFLTCQAVRRPVPLLSFPHGAKYGLQGVQGGERCRGRRVRHWKCWASSVLPVTVATKALTCPLNPVSASNCQTEFIPYCARRESLAGANRCWKKRRKRGVYRQEKEKKGVVVWRKFLILPRLGEGLAPQFSHPCPPVPTPSYP